MPRRRWRIRLSAAAERDFVGIVESGIRPARNFCSNSCSNPEALLNLVSRSVTVVARIGGFFVSATAARRCRSTVPQMVARAKEIQEQDLYALRGRALYPQ